MRRAGLALLLSLMAHAALAQSPVWERGRDGRYEVAFATLGPGTRFSSRT